LDQHQDICLFKKNKVPALSYPVIPITVAEAGILRKLALSRPNSFPHGAHHLGQLCDQRKDGRHCLRPLPKIPDVTVPDLAAFGRRLRSLCGDNAFLMDRMQGALHVDVEQCGWIRAMREVKVSKIIITEFQYYYGTEKYGF